MAAGCAASSFKQGVYRDPNTAFVLGPIPEGWKSVGMPDVDLAFRSEAEDATVAVNSRCHRDGDDVPLEALTRHLFLYFTERQPLSQRELMIDGRAALRSELLARLDGVQKHFTTYVLKKDGCVYDFMYIARVAMGDEAGAAAPPAKRKAFDEFVQGFHTVGKQP